MVEQAVSTTSGLSVSVHCDAVPSSIGFREMVSHFGLPSCKPETRLSTLSDIAVALCTPGTWRKVQVRRSVSLSTR
ncbi:hypothetical protein D3C85_1045160 [compost metagenome]